MKLYAVAFIWNEEDVIAATVNHALTQGVDRFYFVNNGSSDNTVDVALAAGGIHGKTVDTRYYDEYLKLCAINELIQSVNREADTERIWWMIVDADEFPDTRLGMTVREFLEAAPEPVRAVHAFHIQHFPTHRPYYVPGFHPIDFQPHGIATTTQKIPLLRYDKGTPHIYSMGGAHTYRYDGPPLAVHEHRIAYRHFTYRDPQYTRRRLQLLVSKREDGTRRIDIRDAQIRRYNKKPRSGYWERLEGIKDHYLQCQDKHIYAFEEYPFSAIQRWYSPGSIEFTAPAQEKMYWRAGYCLYTGRYAEAQCLFTALADAGFAQEAACLEGIKVCLRQAGTP